MVVVRLLLVLGLGAIVVAGLLYVFTRDRRYLRFLVQVAKFTIWLLAGVMLFYLFERLVIMVEGPATGESAVAGVLFAPMASLPLRATVAAPAPQRGLARGANSGTLPRTFAADSPEPGRWPDC